MKTRGATAQTQAPEGLLFLRRWLAHPLKVGALLPSSPALARLVVKQLALKADQAVIELGAGTGSVTKELVRAGIPPDRLFVVEIDPDLCGYLRQHFRQVQVIQGDAGRLKELIPAKWHGKVSTVISGIPMVPLPLEVQRRLLGSWLSVLAPGGQVLQYTYSMGSPLPQAKLGLKGRRKGIAMLNVPPAWVWSYEPAAPVGLAA